VSEDGTEPGPPHTLNVTVDPEHGVRGRFYCTAPQDAPCRQNWAGPECDLSWWLNQYGDRFVAYYRGERVGLRSGPVLLVSPVVGPPVVWSYEPVADIPDPAREQIEAKEKN
jgi:hypothetical protein